MTQYRIRKNKNGEYLLQSKSSFFSKWHTEMEYENKSYADYSMASRKLHEKRDEKNVINPLRGMFK